MKAAVLLTLCGLVAHVLADSGEVLVSSDETGELDSLTAVTLETFGDLLEDESFEKENTVFQGAVEQEAIPSEEDQVVYANFTDDGMIAVEDMIVSPEMFEVIFPPVPDHPNNTDSQSVHRRAAISSKKRLWPGGRIPYSYHSNLLGSQAKVRAAMDEWEKYTCVKFEYRKTTEKKYVQIRTKMGKTGKPEPVCSSAVGYTGKTQYLNLAKNCFAHKIILHELGHTMGLVHEHQHPARDKYVSIVWGNINPKKKGNFLSRSKSVSAWGITYDPTSIMHYRSTAFRKKGCKKPCYTITSKGGSTATKLIGTAKHLSEKSDIPIITKMYCPSAKTSPSSTGF